LKDILSLGGIKREKRPAHSPCLSRGFAEKNKKGVLFSPRGFFERAAEG